MLVKKTVYLKTETVLALRQMAESMGCSQSELIRDALRLYTSKCVRPLPRGLGKYATRETHVSERTKEFLRSAAQKVRWRR